MPPPILDVPATVKLCLSPGESLALRISSLKALQDYFQGPEAGGRVLRWLPSILPQLLPLLAEPQLDVRSAASISLAVLGAQAAAILPSLPAPAAAAVQPSSAAATTPAQQARFQPGSRPQAPTHFHRTGQPAYPHQQQQQQYAGGRGGSSGGGAAPPQRPAAASAVFFDWTLEALARGAPGSTPGSTPLSPSVKETMLVALYECMERLPAQHLARHAARVMDVCMMLLESETTGLSLLKQLLNIMSLAAPCLILNLPGKTTRQTQQQAAPAAAAAAAAGSTWGSRFTDLIDLLLGWWLDPALTENHRQQISGLVHILGGHWRDHSGFAAEIAQNLVADLAALPVVPNQQQQQQQHPQGASAAKHVPPDQIGPFCLLTGALAAFMAPAATAGAAQKLLVLLPKLLPALAAACLGPSSSSSSVTKATCSCMSKLVPALMAGICQASGLDSSLTTVIASHSDSKPPPQQQEQLSSEDAAFWTADQALLQVVLPLLRLKQLPAALFALALSTCAAIFRAMAAANPDRAAIRLLGVSSRSSSSSSVPARDARVPGFALLAVSPASPSYAGAAHSELQLPAAALPSSPSSRGDASSGSRLDPAGTQGTSDVANLEHVQQPQQSVALQKFDGHATLWSMRSSSNFIVLQATASFMAECLLLPPQVSTQLLKVLLQELQPPPRQQQQQQEAASTHKVSSRQASGALAANVATAGPAAAAATAAAGTATQLSDGGRAEAVTASLQDSLTGPSPQLTEPSGSYIASPAAGASLADASTAGPRMDGFSPAIPAVLTGAAAEDPDAAALMVGDAAGTAVEGLFAGAMQLPGSSHEQQPQQQQQQQQQEPVLEPQEHEVSPAAMLSTPVTSERGFSATSTSTTVAADDASLKAASDATTPKELSSHAPNRQFLGTVQQAQQEQAQHRNCNSQQPVQQGGEWPSCLVPFSASLLALALSYAKSRQVPHCLPLPEVQAAALAALQALQQQQGMAAGSKSAAAAAAAAEETFVAFLAVLKLWADVALLQIHETLCGMQLHVLSESQQNEGSEAVMKQILDALHVLQRLGICEAGGQAGTSPALPLAAVQLLQSLLQLLDPAAAHLAGWVRTAFQSETQGSAVVQPVRLVLSPAAAESALQLLLALLCHDLAAVRAAAVVPACALACCLPQGKEGEAMASCMVSAALDGMCDLDLHVAALSAGLLATLSGPALSTGIAAGSPVASASSVSSSGSGGSMGGLPAWQAPLALAPQGMTFRAEQLQQLFELLVPAAAAGGVLLRGKGEDGAVDRTLGGTSASSRVEPLARRLAISLQHWSASGVDAGDSLAGGSSSSSSIASSAAPARQQQGTGAGEGIWTAAGRCAASELHSQASLPWLLIQEGARFCVASRMRTHLGGPAHSFAGLEKMLQVACARLASAGAISQGGAMAAAAAPAAAGDVHVGASGAAAVGMAGATGSVPLQLKESTWLLLEMVGALERSLHHACEGGTRAPALPRGVLAFFAANSRVCEDWLMGVRPLLLQAASLSGCHHHVVQHGMQRLADLRARLKALMTLQQQQQAAALAAAAAAPPAAAEVEGSKARQGKAAVKVGSEKKVMKAAAPKAATLQQPMLHGRKQQQGSAALAPTLHGATPTTASPAQAALQATNAALYKMAMEVIGVLKQVGTSLVALRDGEGALGLHAWASRVFEPLLRLLQQQRSLLQLRQLQQQQQQQQAAPVSTAAAAAAAGSQQQDGADVLVVEEDQDLPFGDPRHGIRAASAAAAAKPGEGALSWLYAVALEAQGRYEHAVRYYNAFLRTDSWDSPTLTSPQHTTVPNNTANAAASTAASSSSTRPTPGAPTPDNPAHPQDALFTHISTRRFVVERIAECYAAVADWGSLHALASEHQGRAKADPGHASWWAPLAQQLHEHFATASYDLAPGPAAVDARAFKLDAVQSSLLQSIQAAHAMLDLHQQQQQLGQRSQQGPRPGAGQELQEKQQQADSQVEAALGTLPAAWQVLAEQLRLAGLVGLPLHRQPLLQLCCLHELSQHLQQNKEAAGKLLAAMLAAVAQGQQLPLSMPAAPGFWPWAGHTTAVAGHPGLEIPQLSLGSLLLPHQSALVAPASAGPAAADLPSLLTLHRVARVVEAGPTTRTKAAAQQLLLQALQAARGSSNFALCGRVLPAVSPGSSMLGGAAAAAAAAATSEGMLAVLQVEAHGAAALTKCLQKQLAALRPFLQQPALLAEVPGAAGSNAAAAAGSMAHELACVFLSAGHWMSRVPQQMSAAAAAAAGVDWLGLLRYLAAGGGSPAAAAADTAAAMVEGLVMAAAQAATAAPMAMLSGRPYESVCCLLALRLCPAMASAWLQWGNMLYAWTKEQRQAAKAAAAAAVESTNQLQQQQVPVVPGSELEGYAAASEALCLYLATVSGLHAGPHGEQHVPLLLRLLQILVRHGHVLEPRLVPALARCPPALWRPVVPQLLAQLPQASPEARRLLLQRLGAVAEVSPFAVLYPCMVEAQVAEAAERELGPELKALLHQLESSHPRLVSELRLLMSEAQRVTVTWEERWQALLGELQADVGRRFVSLQAEATRLADNANLSTDQRAALLEGRYSTLMSPVLLVLERNLRSNAAAEPETPHERWFLRHVLPRLRAAVAAFKKPPSFRGLRGEADLAQLQTCWAPIKGVLQQLSRVLQQPHQDLRQLSPKLAAMHGSLVPMPGTEEQQMEGEEGQRVGAGLCIAAVLPQMIPLPTKTRPKRLALLGSDGLQYTYLLKGRDDLKADERLMQVLRMVNAMLQADPASSRLGLSVRHYSVTPLGERTGLIQWVTGTASLFSLFKQWQQDKHARHASMAAARQQAEAAGTAAPAGAALPPLQPMAAVARPSDLFYARLVPALQEAGVSAGLMAPRREWPLPVLRRVLLQLAQEAPRSVLAAELWCGSASAAAHWQRQRSFGASLAAASVTGYLVGLGDRHMDNILLDQDTAELVHIDYNICFEKGRKLRVPEIVPFRLTQSLVNALGPPGADGLFRSSCEAALSALRSRREGMAGLLDAVLGDPGVEWSAEREDAGTRQDLELAVALQLFASRMEESREQVHVQVGELLPALDGPGGALCGYVEAHAFLASVRATAEEAGEAAKVAEVKLQAAQAAEAEALQMAAAAAARRSALADDASGLQSAAEQALQECLHWTQRHLQSLAAIRDGGLEEIGDGWRCATSTTPLALLATPAAADASLADMLPRLGIVSEALGPAAQPPFISQQLLDACYQLDDAARKAAGERDRLASAALSALGTYGRLLRLLLPAAYPSGAWHHRWGQVLGMLSSGGPAALPQAAELAPRQPDALEVHETWLALKAAYTWAQQEEHDEQQQEQGLGDSLYALISGSNADLVTDAGSGLVSHMRYLAQAAMDGQPAAADQAGTLFSAMQQVFIRIADALLTQQQQQPGRPLLVLMGQVAGLMRHLELLQEAGLAPLFENLGSTGADPDAWLGAGSMHSLIGRLQVLQHALAEGIAAGKFLCRDSAADIAGQLSVQRQQAADSSPPAMSEGGAPLDGVDAAMAPCAPCCGTALLQSCAAAVQSSCQQLAALLEQGWQQQARLEQHAELLICFHDRQQDLHQRLAQAASVASAGGEHGEAALRDQQLQSSSLQELQHAWEQRHIVAEDLRSEGGRLEEALQACLASFYEVAMGPGAAAAAAAADSRPAPNGAHLPLLQLLCRQQEQQQQHEGAWGSIMLHHVLGSAAAALLQLHDSCAQADGFCGRRQQQQHPGGCTSTGLPDVPPGFEKWQARILAAFSLQHCVNACINGCSHLQQQQQQQQHTGKPALVSMVQELLHKHLHETLIEPLTARVAKVAQELASAAGQLAQGVPQSQQQQQQQQQQQPEQLPELVPFGDLVGSPSLGGLLEEDQGLEGGGAGQGQQEQQQEQVMKPLVGFEGFAGDLEDTWGPELEGLSLEEEGPFEHGHADMETPATEAGAAAAVSVPELSGRQQAGTMLTADQLLSAMAQVFAAAGTRAAAAAEQAIESGVVQQLHAARQQLQLHHLAAYGWLHDHLLLQGKPQEVACVSDPMPGSQNLAVISPGDAVQLYLDQARDPLGGGTRQRISTGGGSAAAAPGSAVGRSHLMAAVRSFVEWLPSLEQQLLAWEAASSQAAMQVQQQLLAAVAATSGSGASPPNEAAVVTEALQGMLARRQRWLAASSEQLMAVGQVAAALLHFEYSRESAAWAPGSEPIHDAFSGCEELLRKAAEVYGSLASAEAEEGQAQGLVEQHRRQARDAQQEASAAHAQETAARGQYEAQLPLLVVGAAELREFVCAIQDALRDSMPLLCHDIGRLLQQLQSAVARQPAARDVTVMTTRVSSHHTPITQVIEQLAAEIPAILGGLDAVSVHSPSIPESTLLAAVADPQIVLDDSELLAAATARGACLIQELAGPVERLVPNLQQLLEMGPSLRRLLTELDSLTSAAASIAAAIQSEHMFQDEQQEDAGVEVGAADVATMPGKGAVAAATAAAATTAAGSGARGWRWGAAAGPTSSRHRRADEARRRAFAAAALRCCIAKLEGRDMALLPQPQAQQQQQQQQSVVQQVDLLIRHATSVDSLAQMFEGWMPWL